MSWPDDGEPRFVVASVTGLPIHPGSGIRTGGRAPIPYASAVLDRAYAHKVVQEFIPTGHRHGLVDRYSTTCRQLAEELCADLNEQDAAGLLTEDAA